MKNRLVRLGVLGTFLNIVCFAGLYGIRFYMLMSWLVLLLNVIPALLNIVVFQNAMVEWELKRQLVVFGIMAGISTVLYTVFAFMFEKSMGYENYVLGNIFWMQEIPENLSGRFFHPLPIIYGFLFNLLFQVMICGTKRVWTREEIERYFDERRK